MDRIRLNIKGLSYSQTQSGAYALVLEEVDGKRKLPIIIGGFEAQSIAIALEKGIDPPRPLTHDLFKSFLDKYEIRIKEVVIQRLQDGVFYSSIICIRDGKEEVFDSRTSDAVALAIRTDSDIYTYEDILQKAGIILEGDVSKQEKQSPAPPTVGKAITPSTSKKSGDIQDKLKTDSIENLEAKMQEAVAKENYELAAIIRNEIDRRNQEKD